MLIIIYSITCIMLLEKIKLGIYVVFLDSLSNHTMNEFQILEIINQM